VFKSARKFILLYDGAFVAGYLAWMFGWLWPRGDEAYTTDYRTPAGFVANVFPALTP
jgi:hypothetical protein